MAKCVHAAGGQWAVKREEEGGGKKEGRSRQDRPFWGDKRVVTHTHRRSRSRRFLRSPPPPFTSPNFAPERRTSELATRDVVVVNTEKKAKRRRGGWMINSKNYHWLMKYILTNQFSVKVQKKLSRAARDIPLAGTRARWDRGAGRNIAIQKILRA